MGWKCVCHTEVGSRHILIIWRNEEFSFSIPPLFIYFWSRVTSRKKRPKHILCYCCHSNSENDEVKHFNFLVDHWLIDFTWAKWGYLGATLMYYKRMRNKRSDAIHWRLGNLLRTSRTIITCLRWHTSNIFQMTISITGFNTSKWRNQLEFAYHSNIKISLENALKSC